MIGLTAATRRLLHRIASTEDASLPLAKRDEKSAQTLVALHLAVLIHRSTGGADIALTAEGIVEASR